MRGWYYWILFKLGIQANSFLLVNDDDIAISRERVREADKILFQSKLDHMYAKGKKDGFAEAIKYTDEMEDVANQTIAELKTFEEKKNEK